MLLIYHISLFDSVTEPVSVVIWGQICEFVAKSSSACSTTIRIKFYLEDYANEYVQVLCSFLYIESGGPWKGYCFRS